MRSLATLVLAVVASFVVTSVAIAGPGTGGRMGGGSWKSSGSTKSYTPSHSSSAPSHTYSPPTHTYSPPTYTPSDTSSFGGGHHWQDSSPHDYSPATSGTTSTGSAVYIPPDDFDSHSSSSSHDSFDVMFWLFAIGIGVAFIGSSLVQRYQDRPLVMGGAVPDLEDVDVSVLRVAIDGRARKFVQTELARIAKTSDTSTDDGRVAMLWEVSLMLRRLRDAWIYGGAVNEAMGDIDREKSIFDHYVDDARVRFREETIANEQGVKSGTDASHYVPRSDEGAGVILVSIIIAARRELFTVNEIASGNDLRAALEAASSLTAETLVAVEIVWQPSEDSDRMSTIELEAKYPRPELLPIAGALVGKTFCKYCGGPFPAELVSCPHCGAPAREAG
ncbi:MAG: DUF1517 domain-containing protein [Deltaproteobacteria bacterium]